MDELILKSRQCLLNEDVSQNKSVVRWLDKEFGEYEIDGNTVEVEALNVSVKDLVKYKVKSIRVTDGKSGEIELYF